MKAKQDGSRFNWRQRWIDEIDEIDEALRVYVAQRVALNGDGRGLERKAIVDEMLDRRTQLQTELEQGKPASA